MLPIFSSPKCPKLSPNALQSVTNLWISTLLSFAKIFLYLYVNLHYSHEICLKEMQLHFDTTLTLTVSPLFFTHSTVRSFPTSPRKFSLLIGYKYCYNQWWGLKWNFFRPQIFVSIRFPVNIFISPASFNQNKQINLFSFFWNWKYCHSGGLAYRLQIPTNTKKPMKNCF